MNFSELSQADIEWELNNNSSNEEFNHFLLNWTSSGDLADFHGMKTDYWHDLFEYKFMRYSAAAMCLFASICSPPVILNVVNYNQNRHIRTILHHMESGIMWNALMLSPVQLIEVARLVFGPLPHFICNANFLLKNSFISIGTVLCLDALVIFRYLYIFVFKNFAPLDEDFFGRFLYLTIGFITTSFGLIFKYIPGKMPVNHYICLGEDPSTDPYPNKKFAMNSILPAMSLVCYIVVTVKIRKHKKRFMAPRINIQNVGLKNDPESTPQPVVCFQMAAMANKSTFVNLAILFLGLTLMVESFLFSLVVNRMTPYEIMSNPLSTFLVYWHQSYAASVYMWGFLGISYYKNPELRTNLKEFLLELFPGHHQ